MHANCTIYSPSYNGQGIIISLEQGGEKGQWNNSLEQR